LTAKSCPHATLRTSEPLDPWRAKRYLTGDPARDNDLDAYQPPFGPAIVVPVGPEGGSGQLPGQEDLASREMVATVKGRDLMVDRYAEILGLTT
jgi:hypothetical protein